MTSNSVDVSNKKAHSILKNHRISTYSLLFNHKHWLLWIVVACGHISISYWRRTEIVANIHCLHEMMAALLYIRALVNRSKWFDWMQKKPNIFLVNVCACAWACVSNKKEYQIVKKNTSEAVQLKSENAIVRWKRPLLLSAVTEAKWLDP